MWNAIVIVMGRGDTDMPNRKKVDYFSMAEGLETKT